MATGAAVMGIGAVVSEFGVGNSARFMVRSVVRLKSFYNSFKRQNSLDSNNIIK
jgi:hypothetical protein